MKIEADEVIYHHVAERSYDFARVGSCKADDKGTGCATGIQAMDRIFEYDRVFRSAAIP